MESTKATIAALLFIVLVVGVNFVMYGIVRGATRSGNKNIFETIGKSFHAANQKKDDSMEELRKKMEELEKGKKDDSGTSS
jgi:ABC-type lipoprotein release transport system permease subunit